MEAAYMLIVQLISGFTQSEEQWNGVQELREKLLSELDDYSSLSVRIRLDVWKSDWYAIARQIYMLRERYPQEPFRVVAFAYSWGVGNGLVRLAKNLDRFGVDIDHAVVSDPVYRHWFSPGNWRAMWGDRRIVIPANVQRMEGFYQTTDKPHGRRPVSDRLTCEPWTLLRRPHAEMDDARPWWERCIEVAKEQAAMAVGSPKNVPATAPESAATKDMDRVPVVNGSREPAP
jgi:pimeloyl-ACP methyl ester carboxylesterase